MEYTVSDQLLTFSCAVLCGACLGVFYEVLRFFRELVYHKKSVVIFCDILFMLVCAFASVLFSICYSRGNTRYFTVAGEALGLLAVRFTLGAVNIRFFLPLMRNILKKCRKFAGNMGKTLKKLLQGCSDILYNIHRKKASSTDDNAQNKSKERGKRNHGVKTAE